MSTATTLPVNPSPAAVEFARLQSWLASSSTLRLPLHHIESQQADKGREVGDVLLVGCACFGIREVGKPFELRGHVGQALELGGGESARC